MIVWLFIVARIHVAIFVAALTMFLLSLIRIIASAWVMILRKKIEDLTPDDFDAVNSTTNLSVMILSLVAAIMVAMEFPK